VTDVTAPSQRATSAPARKRGRHSPAWLIPAAVTAASLVVVLLVALAQ
jgi:hypothetical protein